MSAERSMRKKGKTSTPQLDMATPRSKSLRIILGAWISQSLGPIILLMEAVVCRGEKPTLLPLMGIFPPMMRR